MNKHIVVEYYMKKGGNTAESCITLPIKSEYYDILLMGKNPDDTNSIDNPLYEITSMRVSDYIHDSLFFIAKMQGYQLDGFSDWIQHDDQNWPNEVEKEGEEFYLNR